MWLPFVFFQKPEMFLQDCTQDEGGEGELEAGLTGRSSMQAWEESESCGWVHTHLLHHADG